MVNDNAEREYKDIVKEYYDYTRRFYRVFWHGETLALHYGYHEKYSQNHELALIKMNEMVALRMGQIQRSDVVVDLGCGIGGTSFWVARNLGAYVKGITLSEGQYNKALRLRKQMGLEDRTEFKIGDFFHTGYKDEEFDVAIGIESLCHGQYNIGELSKELYRIIKKGGRLVISDGFIGKENVSAEVKKKITQFEEGFAIRHMITTKAFIEGLATAGFKDIQFHDWTERIMPTAEKMHSLTSAWHWFIVVVTKLRLVPDMILKNNITGQVQLELFKNRDLVYGCITATK